MNSLRFRILRSHLLVIVLTMVIFIVSVMLITPRVHDRLLRDEEAVFRAHAGSELTEQEEVNDPNDGIRPLPGSGLPMQPGESMSLRRFENIYRNAVLLAIVISGALSTIIAVLVSITVARVIAQPIGRLITASRRIAGGNFQHIDVPAATDEIQALAVQFNHMASALKDAEQRRAALIGDVAHELRTPLASIGGYAEGLIDGVVVPNEKTYAIIRDEAGRMQRLVDDLQALSRAEAGTLTLYPAEVDLRDLVARAVTLLDGKTSEAQVRVSVTHQHAHEPLIADADRIVQVVLNLLTNALRASAQNSNIQVTTGHDTQSVWCTVSDTGIGIDAQHLPHIFERFYRVDPSRARSTGGTGVGLTIARAICEAHGGTLTVHSDGLGKGATFTMTLPRDANV
jgi:signal transduction histidine kinase